MPQKAKRTSSRRRTATKKKVSSKNADEKVVKKNVKHHWAFGGPIGTWITMWSLPLVNFWLLTSIENGDATSLKKSIETVLNDPLVWLKSMYSSDFNTSYAFKFYISWFGQLRRRIKDSIVC